MELKIISLKDTFDEFIKKTNEAIEITQTMTEKVYLGNIEEGYISSLSNFKINGNLTIDGDVSLSDNGSIKNSDDTILLDKNSLNVANTKLSENNLQIGTGDISFQNDSFSFSQPIKLFDGNIYLDNVSTTPHINFTGSAIQFSHPIEIQGYIIDYDIDTTTIDIKTGNESTVFNFNLNTHQIKHCNMLAEKSTTFSIDLIGYRTYLGLAIVILENQSETSHFFSFRNGFSSIVKDIVLKPKESKICSFFKEPSQPFLMNLWM